MVELNYLLPSLAGLIVAGVLWRLGRRRRRGVAWTARVAGGALALIACVPLAVGLCIAAGRLRAAPDAVRRAMSPGIVYERLVRDTPRPVVIHLVTIDLATPGLRFHVTPADTHGDLPAATTSDFLRASGAPLAINANYFTPFHDDAAWDYAPHAGDPVRVLGLAASDGRPYGSPWRDAVLNLTADGRAVFHTAEPLHNAVSGPHFVVRDGAPVLDHGRRDAYPRTIAGATADVPRGRNLVLLVADGKQPSYSEGLTLAEAAALLLERGAINAIALDEGGSSTLAQRYGRRRSVNSPCHTHVPDRERPVANHLAVSVGR